MGGEEACPPVLNTAKVPGTFLNGRECTTVPASSGPNVSGSSFNRTWQRRWALESMARSGQDCSPPRGLEPASQPLWAQEAPGTCSARARHTEVLRSHDDDKRGMLEDSSLRVGSHVSCLSSTDSFNPCDILSTQVLLLVGKLRPREAEPCPWSYG